MKTLSLLPRNFRLFLERARSASAYKSVHGQILDALVHKLAINTAFRDYHQYEFYKPGKTMEEKSRYVGLTGSRYWPYETNPPKFAATLTDKYIQKALLVGFGLATPELLSTVGSTMQVRTQKDFNRLLDSIESDIALKPISSAGGRNILVLSRADKDFATSGSNMSLDDIWTHVSKGMERGYLIEKRVVNCEEISAFYPLSLNTFRVVTIKSRDGRWHSPACALKLGIGGNWVDNLAAGGIQVPIDETGTTYKAYDHGAHRTIDYHPNTGTPLNGTKLSCYQSVIDLALEASRKFGFMGTIGWDVAATPDGPMIIEGNTLWAPKFQIPMGGFITDEIASGLRRRTMFSHLLGK